ncbi:serine palmitoyltransferase 2 [Cladophialophora carrionii]|uniref:serine C-palmitoyltransferase n=1 Tax=Cladophialophora carrionii TaxID=86049 RepID=A0A1C1CSF3_9EURO|nr:serine palmitoyltransferase 2 [Cladophialophora carrionii]
MEFRAKPTMIDSPKPQKTSDEPIIIRIQETQSISSEDTWSDTRLLHESESIYSSPACQSSSHRLQQCPLELDVYPPPYTKLWTKVAEGFRLAYTRGKVSLEQPRHSQQPISEAGRFNHCYVHPLDNRKRKNERITLGRWTPRLQVRDGHGTQHTVIQAASHNYAGFYGLTHDSEELQRLALESLPAANSYAMPFLEAAMHEGLAKFFSSEFCYTTSTGYGSNLLAFSALLNQDWLVMFDDKCHNSMHVAAFLSHAGLVKKFPHGNFRMMEAILSEHQGNFAKVLVAIEGFYSMDGTVPALDNLARLKKKYNFTLLADEAHSLMCLGRTGRGAIEVWNEQHSDALVSTDLFDLRTGTLSKSVGAIGGFVCGKAGFAPAVLRRRDEMLANGADPLPTSSILQTLHVLGQPTLLQRNLRRLTAIAIFVREALHRAGVHVYGNAVSPILPVYAGRPSMAARMSYSLRKVGLLATPVSAPAVPFWESRVRICLSADHDNDTVNDIVAAIVKAALNIGLIDKAPSLSKLFAYPVELSTRQETLEACEVAKQIRELIQQEILDTKPAMSDKGILRAGHEARLQYGLGSGGARWVTGTSELHVQVEKMAAKLIGTAEAMTYPDTYIGLMSTIAALSRPVLGFKKHLFLIPQEAPQAVLDGFRVASRKGSPKVESYTNVDALLEYIRGCGLSSYITLFLDVDGEETNLRPLLKRIQQARGSPGMTLLLHNHAGCTAGSFWQDEQALVRSSPGFRDHQFLMFGSFYRAFGLPGAYLAGRPVLLKELRYTSRGYMFTTSQQPFIMGMVAAELKKLMA